MSASMTRSSGLWARSVAVAVIGVGLAVGATGCNNAGQGALSGAGFGALAGMGLGALSGNMGKGAAAGAIIGGIGGAVLGDQNSRHSRNIDY